MRYKVIEAVGSEHEIISYYKFYEDACHYCRGLYNTIYCIEREDEE